ncbi:ACP S-malonyltransferase [Stenotrophobium rhamnosiphilum]|uniref:Malonyl CoA-acyl carrier protein transacylase n=1 Tax=Stenotrophobium rhamnosiphilum TaxID=2029166 RepID=A0A2T5MH62_9GAMM|nr:ACP S-malonyltransferase [Stenotrophobium rhamnosiphilum]PTU31921.1 [acyl-carrier-protein] S-malonyltransferase [Stenotrophobium rhamnosiphilum]
MKYAMLFPGQGSQAVGMLSGHDAPEIAATFAEASQVLGWDVQGLVTQGPAEELNRTERTQPALLAASIAVWRVWQKQGLPAPSALAGHSLGEYSALVAAGALDFADALKIVELRGQLMQAAVPQGTGGMVAVIGLDDDKVQEICKAYPGSEVLEPVNYNAPGQVVVAGQTAALEWLAANGKSLGARMVMKLPVSVPSHCSLMKDAAEKLAARLAQAQIHSPVIPVLHNLDAEARTDADSIRQALKEQLYRPVLWTRTIQNLQSQGLSQFFECGPGKVLCGLGKRISAEAKSGALEDAASMAAAVETVKAG